MSKINYITVVVILVAIVLIVYWYFLQGVSEPLPDNIQATDTIIEEDTQIPTSTSEDTQLPNPASVYCIESMNGTLDIIDTVDGQVGICNLPDGRRCEEWELFRTGSCTLPIGINEPIPGDKGGYYIE